MRNRHMTRLVFDVLENRISPAVLPDFSLPDLSPTSPTSGQMIDPSMFRGEVSAFYFTDPG
jgi:hypothetical protein